MLATNQEKIYKHLLEDLELRKNDVVFLFSGTWGLGKLEGGFEAITKAFNEVLSEGLLLVPTFSYSWCEGKEWDPKKSPCELMGGYANSVWKDPSFVRSNQANFSFAALKNNSNEKLINNFFEIDNSCFGEKSIFGNAKRYSQNGRAFILLFGGAFKDCIFRCPFIHYSQQKIGIPYRFEKKFFNPNNQEDFVTQYSRYVSKDEYIQETGSSEPPPFDFPALENFTQFGVDLEEAGLIERRKFAFHESRMVSVKDCCEFFENKLREDIFYCFPR